MTNLSSPLVCILVHFGDPVLTVNCVVSLRSGSHIPRLIVVSNTDDANTLALHEALRARAYSVSGLAEGDQLSGDQPSAQSDICILPLGANKGFAAACNAGLRLARQSGGVRFVWLLNNDAIVAPDAAERLLSCLERHPHALCGTSVFRADAPEHLELALGCRFSPITTIISPCHAGALPQEAPSAPSVDYIYGASLALPLSLVDDIGVLDEDFFLYYEEHDYCVRARKAGYAFHWCREAHVWHGFVSPSAVPLASSVMREFKHFHESRSTVLFLRKHHRLLLFPALLLRTLGKGFVLWRRGQLWLLRSYFRGMQKGLSRVKVG